MKILFLIFSDCFYISFFFVYLNARTKPSWLISFLRSKKHYDKRVPTKMSFTEYTWTTILFMLYSNKKDKKVNLVHSHAGHYHGALTAMLFLDYTISYRTWQFCLYHTRILSTPILAPIAHNGMNTTVTTVATHCRTRCKGARRETKSHKKRPNFNQRKDDDVCSTTTLLDYYTKILTFFIAQ